jgi:hypothetical protein
MLLLDQVVHLDSKQNDQIDIELTEKLSKGITKATKRIE